MNSDLWTENNWGVRMFQASNRNFRILWFEVPGTNFQAIWLGAISEIEPWKFSLYPLKFRKRRPNIYMVSTYWQLIKLWDEFSLLKDTGALVGVAIQSAPLFRGITSIEWWHPKSWVGKKKTPKSSWYDLGHMLQSCSVWSIQGPIKSLLSLPSD